MSVNDPVFTTLSGREQAVTPRQTFSPLLIIGLVITGLFAFSALILLWSYSDELRPDDPTTASAQDPGAVGYLALFRLLDEAGIETVIDPYPHRGVWDGQSIRLYFPTPAFSEDRFERIDPNVPGVMVLPKWSVFPVEEESADVVRRRDPGLSLTAQQILSIILPDHEVLNAEDISSNLMVGDETLDQIKHLQFIALKAEDDGPVESSDGEPLPQDSSAAAERDDETTEGHSADSERENSFEDELEKMVRTYGRLDRTPLQSDVPTVLNGLPVGDVLFNPDDNFLMILAEPDLLNNQGLRTESRARAALAVLNIIATRFEIDDPIIVFDDSLRRRDTDQNLVKLLTRPPFLAATLCLLAAGLLVGWQGANRFADPVEGGDYVPRGPATLARTAAQFIRGAGRLNAIAPDYADVVRRQVIIELGLSNWSEVRIDAFLATRENQVKPDRRFAEIKQDQGLTPVTRAQALQRWKEEILS